MKNENIKYGFFDNDSLIMFNSLNEMSQYIKQSHNLIQCYNMYKLTHDGLYKKFLKIKTVYILHKHLPDDNDYAFI